LLSGEKFSTLPEPLIPMVAPGVFILNLSLLKLAIAPVKARNVPFTKDKILALDASGLPLNWYWSIRNSVSARIAMKAPSLMRNCAIPSLPDTMVSLASTSLPFSTLRSPDAFTTRTSPITKLNFPAAATLSETGKNASNKQSATLLSKMDFILTP